MGMTGSKALCRLLVSKNEVASISEARRPVGQGNGAQTHPNVSAVKRANSRF